MTQKRKLEERIMEGSPRGDITFNEIETFLSQKGVFQKKGNGSSHHIFVFPTKNGGQILFSIPCHPSEKSIGRVYIKQIRLLISELEEGVDTTK
jgi:hypothetical protein